MWICLLFYFSINSSVYSSQVAGATSFLLRRCFTWKYFTLNTWNIFNCILIIKFTKSVTYFPKKHTHILQNTGIWSEYKSRGLWEIANSLLFPASRFMAINYCFNDFHICKMFATLKTANWTKLLAINGPLCFFLSGRGCSNIIPRTMQFITECQSLDRP